MSGLIDKELSGRSQARGISHNAHHGKLAKLDDASFCFIKDFSWFSNAEGSK